MTGAATAGVDMNCVCCGSAAVRERREVTARGYRRFRRRHCGRQFNERSGEVLNRTCLPSDIIAFVVFCRLRYRLTLRDLSEIMALRGFEVSHKAVRDWEAKLLPVMGDELGKRRHGARRGFGISWYVDETYPKVRGRWCYLYRTIDREANLIDAMLSEQRDMRAAKAFFRSARATMGFRPGTWPGVAADSGPASASQQAAVKTISNLIRGNPPRRFGIEWGRPAVLLSGDRLPILW
jgi:putative transposase